MPLVALAQNDGGKAVQLHGAIQTEFLVPQQDDKIGTEKTSDKVLNNTYLDLNLNSEVIDAGARFEYLQHPLPGFDKEFKGWGVPHVYVKAKAKGFDITMGDFYEQFGSGFILRAYEERSLGIDNSLRGVRAKINAIPGMRVTALAGVQRCYWNWSLGSTIYGADAEIDMNEYFHYLSNRNINWTIGGSWVMKQEENKLSNNKVTSTSIGESQTSTLAINYPGTVNAFDVRTNVATGGFRLLAEYAQKTQDPSAINSYTFHKGNAAMVSASYSKTGFAALLQVKRSEDMAFRSQRGITGDMKMGMLNHMPAFAFQHTYALPSLYPYGTQYGTINDGKMMPGEWAYQGEVAYTFKRKTALGGKYGTKLKLNFSHIRALDVTPVPQKFGSYMGTDGYKSSVFGNGEELYTDVNLTFEKKFTKDFKLNLMYMYQNYNKTVIEGHGGMVRSHIMVADGRYQFSPKTTLRVELQYLATAHESGNWFQALAELSLLPHFMITASDMYGRPVSALEYGPKQHYYMFSCTYSHGAHRAMLGYGLTRRGFDCSGGVCREVPATKGLRATYNYTF